MKLRLSICVVALTLAACGHTESEESTASPPSSNPTATTQNIQIQDYGPKNAKAGVPFNAQADGSSAMWFKVNESLEGSVVNVHFGELTIPGDISGATVTIRVPQEAHVKVGTVAVSIDKVDGKSVRRSDRVTLVLEKP